MKISAINNTIFGKRASIKEIQALQEKARNAKSKYRALEDKAFLSVDNGMETWLKAKEAGFQMADKLPEGKKFRQAESRYRIAHIDPCSTDEKELKRQYLEARANYYNKADLGREFYFINHPKANAIRQQARQKVCETQEGFDAMMADYRAADKLQMAVYSRIMED